MVARGRPPLMISAQHYKKKKSLLFIYFLFFMPGTIFHL